MSADRVFLDANILFSISYGSTGLYRLWELAQTGDVAHFGKYFGQAIMGVNICRARDYISLKNNAGFTSD